MTIDELAQYGLERMDDGTIDAFLDEQSVGVLGLPTGDVPYLIPLSYARDGDSLYFTYLVGDPSEKDALTTEARRGRFLVYEADTAFRWQSVMLTGDLTEVPESEWGDLSVHPSNSWRPSVLQSATTAGGVKVYEFAVADRAGIKQTGLAPDFRENISPRDD
jgi:hypothetical protein